MFKVGDVVEWCGAIGVVSRIFKDTVYCEFCDYRDLGAKSDMNWFASDGRFKPYHVDVSLRHASNHQIEFYRKRADQPERGVAGIF